MKIVGICRFSFFGPSDTKIDYTESDAAFKTLYNPARMEQRFQLFERLFLPSIREQIDQNFKLIIITSQIMPEEYRARLLALCEPVQTIHVHFAKTTNLRREIMPFLRRFTRRGRHHIMQFRIDDDDALSVRYVQRLREWSTVARPGMLLTMPKGIMLVARDDAVHSEPIHRPFTGAGYAYYTDAAALKNIYSFAHIKSGRMRPAISDPTLCAYIQCFHSEADTAARQHRRIKQFQKDRAEHEGPSDDEALVRQFLAEDFPYLTLETLHDILSPKRKDA